MKKILQIGNILAFILVLVVNYLSNTGFFNDTTIADVSSEYSTLITPAPYTFSIWGLIYLLLLGFVVFQVRSLFVKNARDGFVEEVGWWFIISCTANCLWIITWLNGYTLLSIVVMLVLLTSLMVIIFRNRMELYDAPLSVIAFLWWPFVLYAGWITVAAIVNISAFLVKIQWNGWGLDPEIWTVLMILVATGINILAVKNRNMREFAGVGVWAFIGIAAANWSVNILVQYTTLAAALALIILISIQAYRNIDTNPVTKLRNGEIR